MALPKRKLMCQTNAISVLMFFSDKLLFHETPFPMAVPFMSLFLIQKRAINVIFTFCNDQLSCPLCYLHVQSLVQYFLIFFPFCVSDLVSSQQLLCLSAHVRVCFLCLPIFANAVSTQLAEPKTFPPFLSARRYLCLCL